MRYTASNVSSASHNLHKEHTCLIEDRVMLQNDFLFHRMRSRPTATRRRSSADRHPSLMTLGLLSLRQQVSGSPLSSLVTPLVSLLAGALSSRGTSRRITTVACGPRERLLSISPRYS